MWEDGINVFFAFAESTFIHAGVTDEQSKLLAIADAFSPHQQKRVADDYQQASTAAHPYATFKDVLRRRLVLNSYEKS